MGERFMNIEIPDPAASAEVREELKRLNLKLAEAEFDNTDPITLEVIYRSAPVRANTACWAKNYIVKNGLD
jgi:hypothetical protein